MAVSRQLGFEVQLVVVTVEDRKKARRACFYCRRDSGGHKPRVAILRHLCLWPLLSLAKKRTTKVREAHLVSNTPTTPIKCHWAVAPIAEARDSTAIAAFPLTRLHKKVSITAG